MSLIRPTDVSATSYGDSKLYTRKSSSENSGLSTQVLSADKRRFMCGTETKCRGTYEQPYFSSSPAEASPSSSGPTFGAQEVSFHQLLGGSDSISSGNSFRWTSEYLDGLSPDDGTIDCDEYEIRFKLQELERELLYDNDEFSMDQNMDIDGDWADSISNLVLSGSPKDSSSDGLVINPVSSPQALEDLTPKQMLFNCAALISEGRMTEASTIISKLRQTVSIQGDPPQRVAAYMTEGLAARIATSGRGLYKALKCKEPPTTDRLSAMQILFEVCPCFKFGFMAANGAIAEAFKDEQGVHIVDFDINQGSQYITLIQALASHPGKSPPHVRITGVDDPETVQRTVGGLRVIGQRLENLAEAVGVSLEFHAVAVKTEDVTPSMLACRPNEALVVNFAFQLHHMPDESVSTVNQRDQLLRMVKSLKPKLVTIVEQDVNTNTAPFFPRFVEAYNYYSAVFESLDATLPRESPDRMNVERHCLARDIINIVACEGEDRIERYEVAGKWRARMTMAGFKPYPLSTYVNGTIRDLLKQYCDRYKVKEEGGGLQFGWEDKILIVASAWK